MNLDERKYGERKKKESRLRWLADQLKTVPERTIVIGNAEKDLTGATRAGMRFIAIPNRYTKENDFSGADATHASLQGLSVREIERIMASTIPI